MFVILKRLKRIHCDVTRGCNKIHVCHQCDYKAATKQKIEIHKLTIHERIKFSYDQCGNIKRMMSRKYMKGLNIIVINVSINEHKKVI